MTASTAEFASALHLLTAPTLLDRTLPHIYVADRRIDWDAIRALPVSDGEQVLVDAAFTCWTGWTGLGRGDMAAAIRVLDDRMWAWLIDGLQMRRGCVKV